ncbi:hypothetical protein EVAR_15841_1 [Eumeta japonica]|uniref:Uncharacterized protein n=1 Tax=Eumeta variegata TaxID=151549 RepID=A0A4C1UDX1_EUMVA|nr:hypothetical protein EVAR_15841_1 [Eumeta japonica]
MRASERPRPFHSGMKGLKLVQLGRIVGRSAEIEGSRWAYNELHIDSFRAKAVFEALERWRRSAKERRLRTRRSGFNNTPRAKSNESTRSVPLRTRAKPPVQYIVTVPATTTHPAPAPGGAV